MKPDYIVIRGAHIMGNKMQSPSATPADLSGLYDADFFEWTRRNAELLRAGKVRQSDIGHIAEEIEDLGKQDFKELHRRSRALLAHLLVGQVQPAKHAHWRLAPIAEERIWLDGLVEYSPSLKTRLASELPAIYGQAVRLAMAMARPAAGRVQFPVECPFTAEQILDAEFLPRLRKEPDAVTTC
jgi:hypothetical protein